MKTQGEPEAKTGTTKNTKGKITEAWCEVSVRYDNYLIMYGSKKSLGDKETVKAAQDELFATNLENVRDRIRLISKA